MNVLIMNLRTVNEWCKFLRYLNKGQVGLRKFPLVQNAASLDKTRIPQRTRSVHSTARCIRSAYGLSQIYLEAIPRWRR
jgi:hypothetical protein